MLRDILKQEDEYLSHVPFGGKVMILGGDARQTLPIKQLGGRAAVVKATLCNSPLWRHFKLFTLEENVRVGRLLQQGADAHELREHANFLLQVGEGRVPGQDGSIIRIPDRYLCEGRDPGHLSRVIYGDLSEHRTNDQLIQHLADRVILCPKNSDVDTINDLIVQTLPGQEKTFYSSDTVDETGEQGGGPNIYPMEFINAQTPSGTPRHKITIRVGAVFILLRNLGIYSGLANGTRCLCTAFQRNVIQAVILTGDKKGTVVFIPRISITPTDTNLPFTFTRRQFPIKLAYAMTINKSQGQTFKLCGVFLPQPVFAHGQLYVALSRVGDPDGLKVMVPHDPLFGFQNREGTWTKNIVYREVITQMTQQPTV